MTLPTPPHWGRMSRAWYDTERGNIACELCGRDNPATDYSPTTKRMTGLDICSECVERHAEDGAD